MTREIESLLDQVEDELGEYSKSDSGNVGFDCPFCEKKGLTPDTGKKLRVSVETGKWQCWRCESKGPDLYALLKRMQVQAVVPLADFNTKMQNLFNPFKKKEEVVKEKVDIITSLQDYIIYELLESTDAGQYARTRQISQSQIDWFGLKGCYFKYRHRLFIPCYEKGNLVFFQSRHITSDVKGPKYTNPSGVNKAEFVMNIDHPYSTTIICEGPLSAISAGFNSVCTYGKSPSPTQLEKLLAKKSERYYCCYETDFFENNIKLADTLAYHGAKAHLCILPEGKDPNNLSQEEMHYVLDSAQLYVPTKTFLINAYLEKDSRK